MALKKELDNFIEEVKQVAEQLGCHKTDLSVAEHLDSVDPLKDMRNIFVIPKLADIPDVIPEAVNQGDGETECIYLCGHSLGLPPKTVSEHIDRVISNWKKLGVESHIHGYLPAAFCELEPKPLMAKLVGAKESEVVIMNSLTVNIHFMLCSFYRPSDKRFKLVIEEEAFPSDLYAIRSHLELHNRPEEDLILIKSGKDGLLDEDSIVELIEKEGDSIALLLLPGTQYYSGQVLNIKRLTDAAHKKGCIVMWDLAHSVGNVSLKLHEWDVDVAVWCNYKYLSCGAGGIGAAFVHERLLKNDKSLPMLKGWWGNRVDTKFQMKREFEPVPESAEMFKVSNTSPLLVAPLLASLKIFDSVDEDARLKKQLRLTGYLEFLIKMLQGVCILTPEDPAKRGSQLSLIVKGAPKSTQEELAKHGVMCDVRYPLVIRVSPIPFYNSYKDVWRFYKVLRRCIGEAK